MTKNSDARTSGNEKKELEQSKSVEKYYTGHGERSRAKPKFFVQR